MVTNRWTVTAGARGTSRRVTRGRGCLRATRRRPGASLFRTQYGRAGRQGSDRRGGQAGESRSLASGWISWVLVDNKSVAEIGERHLVQRGYASLRRDVHSVHQRESASHHRDGREAGARGKGARTVWSWAITFAICRQPGRWPG